MHGPISFVASADLGPLGPSESEPVVVNWHWTDDTPAFAGVARWALILGLLLVVKANRNWQAWLILIPFALLGEFACDWINPHLTFLSMRPVRFGLGFQWLATAWTTLWLVSPWLARCRPLLAFVLALATGTAIGAANHFGLYGHRELGPPLTTCAAWLLALLTAFALSGLSCRQTNGAGRFLAWLIPWLVIGTVVGLTSEYVWLDYHPTPGSRPMMVPTIISNLELMSLSEAAILYLWNLPFLCLAFWLPTYRERFTSVLRLPHQSPSATPTAAGTETDNASA